MSTVLLITSDHARVDLTRQACAAAEMTLHTASSVGEAWPDDVAVFVCDDEHFDALRRRRPSAPIIVCGRAGDSARAIEAIRHGAHDYLIPPHAADELARQLKAAARITGEPKRRATWDDPSDRPADVDRIIGQSPAMQDVYKAIGRIAPRDINVLITGESGTGKELVARAILNHSPRRDQPYLAVNCAAIPETLLESELFGHEKGAFTGADQQRLGTFERCNNGTLFLDEIGDIPMSTQAKLLRVLQDQTFQRVGGSETIQCDVRLIAATHQPLETLIEERRFRPDLFYRLNVASIHVPPLREREVDVVLLAHYFVERDNAAFGTHIEAFAPETLRVLLQHPWPGNVRQLENAIRATLVNARGTVLRPEFLPDSVRRESESNQASGAMVPEAVAAEISSGSTLAEIARQSIDAAPETSSVYNDAIAEFERELIRAALRKHGGKIAPAARQLGIGRTTLRRKMAAFDIEITTT